MVKGRGMIEVYAQNLEDSWFAIALNQKRIVSSSFAACQETALNNVLSNLPFNCPFQVFHEPSTFAKTVLATLKAIYDGKDTQAHYDLALDRLPPYSRKVVKATAAIPVGYVTSYGALAKAVGGGARAVGNAMACNLFPPLVPCHRVVKSDLGLGGYGAGGLKVKLMFLEREKRGYTEPKQVAVDGGCLDVFPVECVLEKLAQIRVRK
jgi:O-6-methylguanine DNA methyltransferase